VYQVIRRIVECGCSDFAARSLMTRFANRSRARPTGYFPLLARALHQRQNPLSFPRVIEGMETADFIEAPLTIEGVEVMCVGRGELACLEVAAAQVCVAKCVWALPDEKMEVQPASVSSRDTLGFTKKSDKE